MKLGGRKKPAGEGMLIEVHVDLLEVKPEFLGLLQRAGFEDHPFTVFHPVGYIHHMTGRLRKPLGEIHDTILEVSSLVNEIVSRGQVAGESLYVETELVRFSEKLPGHVGALKKTLDRFTFNHTRRQGGAQADIHMKWQPGTVSDEVREYLLSKHFYWVSMPDAPDFPGEEVATLQTQSYACALDVYTTLVAEPLPGCTGIALEQKLAMHATRPDLPMPEVIEVS